MVDQDRTFVGLYEKRCELDGEEPEHMKLYEDLDRLMTFINQNDSPSKPFRKAFMHDRECVLVPYDMYEEKRIPPDDFDENGDPMSYSCPGLDIYRTMVIDQMDNSYGVDQFEDDETMLTQWKLNRLGKVINMGWDKYAERYLSDEN